MALEEIMSCLRKFTNSTELADGRILELVQFYLYDPPSFSYPEEWDSEGPEFRIDGKLCDREEVLTTLSTEELEEFVDSAIEDTNYSPPRSDEEHLI
jgi:hypothetical protein